MAANNPAWTGEDASGLSKSRYVLGVVIVCIFAASCSSSDSTASLNLAPTSYETAAETDSGMSTDISALQTAASAIRPSTRPNIEDEAEDAQTAAAQPSESNSSQVASPQEGEQLATAEAPAPETETEPQKRSLLGGLFAAPSKAPARIATSDLSNIGISPQTPAAESKTAAVVDTPEPEREAEARETAIAKAEDAGVDSPADKQIAAADAAPAPAETQSSAPKKGFLSAFFAPVEKRAPIPDPVKAKSAEAPFEEAEEEAVVTMASATASPPAQASVAGGEILLPGVRGREQLFDIRSSSELTDDSNLDIYEEEGSYQVASAAGLARLAPNGLMKQRESVDVSCFKPGLMHILRTIESHYGKRVLVTSGYRSPSYNRRVNGARNSMHMHCAAADIQIEGVSKWELARFARTLPRRGGVGTYCHTNSVHVDVGPERDWNWRCGRR